MQSDCAGPTPTRVEHGVLHLQDDNMGLVKLVLQSQVQRRVQRLTQTFLTLSLEDIAQAVGLGSAAEAEHAILRCLVFFQLMRPKLSRLLPMREAQRNR